MLKLSVLCGEYEIVRPLREGTVKPKGIELEFVRYPGTREIHTMVSNDEGADINEYNGGAYVMAKAAGKPFTSLPVFLHRRFRHSFIYVNTKSGIERPQDLKGKTMGTNSFTAAAEFWMRGHLEDDYGVAQEDMTWVIQAEHHHTPYPTPKGLKVRRPPKGKNVLDMFVRGEVDAFMGASIIEPIIKKDPRVRRLFTDYKATEREYFERTGIFPIMHVTTIRSDLVKKEPWVVESLTTAFEESKQLLFARLFNPRIVPLAWWMADWEEERDFLGPDPWEYGLSERNQKNYGMLMNYVCRQVLGGKKMKLEQLFPKEAFALKAPFRQRHKVKPGF